LDRVILVFELAGGKVELYIDRDPNENEEDYRRRLELYGSLFGGRRNSDGKS
jgi:hypothetical protein